MHTFRGAVAGPSTCITCFNAYDGTSPEVLIRTASRVRDPSSKTCTASSQRCRLGREAINWGDGEGHAPSPQQGSLKLGLLGLLGHSTGTQCAPGAGNCRSISPKLDSWALRAGVVQHVTSLGRRRRWTWEPNLGLVNGLLNGAFCGGGNRDSSRGEPRLKRQEVTRSCEACRVNAKSPPEKTPVHAGVFFVSGVVFAQVSRTLLRARVRTAAASSAAASSARGREFPCASAVGSCQTGRHGRGDRERRNGSDSGRPFVDHSRCS